MCIQSLADRAAVRNGSIAPSVIYAIQTQQTVTGTVLDDTHSPLPGVNVVLKGTNTGTTTDAEGKYTIQLPDQTNATLIFSFIGYVTMEESVDSRSTIDVTMTSDVQSLNEVVVIGYQTVEKKDLTGAVSSVSPAAANRVTTNSLAESMADQTDDPFFASWRKTASPVFTNFPDGDVFGPGHCAFFSSPDASEDWIVYHANAEAGEGCGDNRSTRMQRYSWSTDTGEFGRPAALDVWLNRPSDQ
jgi:hypothetical protein